METIPKEIWEKLSENVRKRLKTPICVSMPAVQYDFFLKRYLSNKTAFDSMKEREKSPLAFKSSFPSMDECAEAFVALGEACGESTANVSMFGDEFTNLYLGDWHENKINTRCSSHGIEFCFTCKCKTIKRGILRGQQWKSFDYFLR